MSSRWVVDNTNQLKELGDPGSVGLPPGIRLAARVISWVFHPVFVPVYIALFLVLVLPVLVSSFTVPQKLVTLFRFFLLYTFFPLVTVLLSRALGFLDSIYLKTQRDRIIPYVTCMIYYFWMWFVLRNQTEFAPLVVALTFGIFLASIVGLMANIYMKISMHAIAMGVMVTFMISLAFTQATDMGLYLCLALLVAGLVCTSRFIVSNHAPKEIYGGFLAGIAAQLAAELARGILY
jgi:hypothetical protein